MTSSVNWTYEMKVQINQKLKSVLPHLVPLKDYGLLD